MYIHRERRQSVESTLTHRQWLPKSLEGECGKSQQNRTWWSVCGGQQSIENRIDHMVLVQHSATGRNSGTEPLVKGGGGHQATLE